ncbi:uncharacterized protein LOC106461926 [Limulus polyphemus]|uniref:Uncharacterized protein LOC106461926 n=1 Tax=Limulus polyphemus TaxID=6850 RepID=A0ABM1SM80_LIMPO|nr:uncharacterized protein LOC106461926 [Limulus polyphemus]
MGRLLLPLLLMAMALTLTRAQQFTFDLSPSVRQQRQPPAVLDLWAPTTIRERKTSNAKFFVRERRGSRQYDVPQIECPPAEDGTERFACPTPDRMSRYRCIDDHELCDGFIDCPQGEDEDRQACMFYKTVALLFLVACSIPSARAESYGVPLPVPAYQPPQLYKPRAVIGPDVYEESPKPYNFGYQIQDEAGNTQEREESGDEAGNVQGSYGYTDGLGLYRKVQYVADTEGFRATIESNEPGLTNANPANVEITAQEPPAHIQDAYSAPIKAVGFKGPADRSYSVPRRFLNPRPVAPSHITLPHPGASPLRSISPTRLAVLPHGTVGSNRVGVSPFTVTSFKGPSISSPRFPSVTSRDSENY